MIIKMASASVCVWVCQIESDVSISNIAQLYSSIVNVQEYE